VVFNALERLSLGSLGVDVIFLFPETFINYMVLLKDKIVTLTDQLRMEVPQWKRTRFLP